MTGEAYSVILPLIMIHKLSLVDFRNYKEKHFEFTEKNVVFYGGNGKGKTNILEAISILSMGKSWRETAAEDLIREDSISGVGMIRADLDNKDSYTIKISPRSRSFQKNEKKISLKQHFGKIPTLLFVPEHLMLFSGSKRNRQRFFDRFLFQTSPQYRENLTKFNRALKQKNALLKQLNESSTRVEKNFQPGLRLLHPWNEILADTIPPLVQVRRDFLKKLNPLLQKELKELSRSADSIEVQLEMAEVSHLEEITRETVLEFFTKHLNREQAAGKCLLGPHRDDFVFHYREKPILASASRGEERSGGVCCGL